jgi:hypothetical protein
VPTISAFFAGFLQEADTSTRIEAKYIKAVFITGLLSPRDFRTRCTLYCYWGFDGDESRSSSGGKTSLLTWSMKWLTV